MVILVTNNGLGSLQDPEGKADVEFSQKMMGLFLRTLGAFPDPPEKILFYTEGVKLVAADSPVVAELGELERRGTQIISCGTCLDYFGLTDRVAVGEIGGMGDILRAILEADKVVTV